MCPREFTRSFVYSGVLNRGDSVSTGGTLGSSSWRRKDVPWANGFGVSAKKAPLIGVCGGPASGVFLFRALDRLKVGVGKGSDEFFVRMAGVLVTGGDVPRLGFGNGGGVAAHPGLACLSVVVPHIDDVGAVISDAIVSGAGFRCAWLALGVL